MSEVFFSGLGGAVVGAIVGAIIACSLTYYFQQKLLSQQLEFLKQQAEADAKLRAQIHKETTSLLEQLRHQIHGVVQQIVIANLKR